MRYESNPLLCEYRREAGDGSHRCLLRPGKRPRIPDVRSAMTWLTSGGGVGVFGICTPDDCPPEMPWEQEQQDE